VELITHPDIHREQLTTLSRYRIQLYLSYPRKRACPLSPDGCRDRQPAPRRNVGAGRGAGGYPV